ncbi:hypothetical protein LIER_28072 [Lithospermum erythrorhizon]|uniref:Uncharacterized protein n=1 Tax=Lithospermum erythrorhizon TaxID=34254 RepID=A0AAV3RHY8_LITER
MRGMPFISSHPNSPIPSHNFFFGYSFPIKLLYFPISRTKHTASLKPSPPLKRLRFTGGVKIDYLSSSPPPTPVRPVVSLRCPLAYP